MTGSRLTAVLVLALSVVGGQPSVAQTTLAQTTTAQTPFEPKSGQAGKDVVWVPTPQETVERMLDMANVSPADFVVDLGSGDGRNVIAAARRGARALGVEFNADMVELSRRTARDAGVADKATFVQGDMYEAEFSDATVLALFLLPTNLNRLSDKFLRLKPGTRIVLNTFSIEGWQADVTEEVPGCSTWCTAMLVIVPARVEGTWQMSGGHRLTLTQKFQMVSGNMVSAGATTDLSSGRLRGEELRFNIGPTEYTGRVQGDRIEGSVTIDGKPQTWSAVRER